MPDLFYKYRNDNISKQGLHIIEDLQLWCPSAKSFNDPFDTALTYSFRRVQEPIAEKWIVDATERHWKDLSSQDPQKYIAERLRQLRTDPKEIEYIRENFIHANLAKFGICSLSEVNDDLLMWGHYTNNHKGFCVGLRRDLIDEMRNDYAAKGELVDLVQVVYSTDMPDIDIFHAMLNQDEHEDIIAFIATKSNHWSYEKEYRLIYWDYPNKSIPINPKIISEIFMGCQMDAVEIKKITELCKKVLPHVKLYHATKNMSKFALDFQRIYF